MKSISAGACADSLARRWHSRILFLVSRGLVTVLFVGPAVAPGQWQALALRFVAEMRHEKPSELQSNALFDLPDKGNPGIGHEIFVTRRSSEHNPWLRTPEPR